jgi:chromosome segregation and condensation protein ScpB
MSKNTLTRKTQWLRGAERKDVLSTLVESGQVVIMEQVETGGRPATRYRRA